MGTDGCGDLLETIILLVTSLITSLSLTLPTVRHFYLVHRSSQCASPVPAPRVFVCILGLLKAWMKLPLYFLSLWLCHYDSIQTMLLRTMRSTVGSEAPKIPHFLQSRGSGRSLCSGQGSVELVRLSKASKLSTWKLWNIHLLQWC